MLRLIQGGKPEPKAYGEDWLRELGFDARFICKKKTDVNSYHLPMYGIAFIADYGVLLAAITPGMPTTAGWVDSKLFSKQHHLIKVLSDEPDKESGVSNGYHLSGPADRKDYDGHEEPPPLVG